ncbi:hypothetical protein [Flavobacterium yafengii]|uniref:hypothetical protein n=1 Tax=Flavobacterium yafengii TaxID=3041253 RepID=UPI0024A7DE20|nr:hypothetical protein [Flavobacterium yafengii]MDI6048040.1 hypothetical protein [Flavobacterium yafengii]
MNIPDTKITTNIKKINFKTLAILTILILSIIDFCTPLGTAIGALYLIPMTMVIDQKKSTLYVFSFISTILILFKFFYFQNSNTHISIYSDRLISMIALWVVTFILIAHKTQRNKTEKLILEHNKSITEMLFKINHKIRHSVSQILGLTYTLLKLPIDSKDEIKELLNHIHNTTQELDLQTKELIEFMIKEKQYD